MSGETLLKWSNASMLFFLLAFGAAVYGAWGLEAELPLMAITLLHVAQIVTAGLFKLAYVLRLVAQSQLGRELR
ncbi:hypothetical protein CWE12_05420 [Aliidiomarina sedimenti]|uniref:Uncharacterized protein n=1 Tax=Aliidiomarina sedimenti TaxID=1933879 RepID=A0ABY0C057_9GAMM|nr:hypothetical protein [Aliidiomarina sedimenti]RUO30685.1 hypothetical protein CWE12_05420 [Aliidiomarina sedimenti]